MGELIVPMFGRPSDDSLTLLTGPTPRGSLVSSAHTALTQLAKLGAVLFRGFDVQSRASFERTVTAVTPKLRRYDYASTPRTHEGGGIYTSTEYPSDQTIPLHNEMSYSRAWPMVLWFVCLEPAREGGATPLADAHDVYTRIDPAIRRRFESHNVLYVRNYGTGLDLSWEAAFGTHDRTRVEAYCREQGMAFEWKSEGVLKTWQVCQGVATHPVNGLSLWFNQAHLFHISALEANTRAALLEVMAEDDLPRNAYYGDGGVLENSVMEEVRAAYTAAQVHFDWHRGDLLLVDNMQVAHGREPFRGSRRVLVAMS